MQVLLFIGCLALGLAAISLEVLAVMILFLHQSAPTLLLHYFLLHTLGCLAMTPLVWAILPRTYQTPRGWTMLLLFCLGFFIPVVGIPGFMLALLIARWLPHFQTRYRFNAVLPPTYELPKAAVEVGWRSGRVRQQLSNKQTPVDFRMRALLALQHMQPRYSSGILREALSDSSDDLRLLAYGMLDMREKKLTHRIHEALQRYQNYGSAEERYIAARELAELYWELVYQNLVQGDMRNYALEAVHTYTTEALNYKIRDAGLWVISGRMWMLRGEYIRAMGSFTTAITQGFPLIRAQPYLAELAYLRGDISTTRRLMKGLQEQCYSRQLRMAADYWGQS